MIINEPDFWMVNLLAKTAQHGLDPGPTFNCRQPIFVDGPHLATDDESKQIRELEFGQEIEFFKGKGVIPQSGPVLETKSTTEYKLQIGETTLALYTTGTPERPLAVARRHGNKGELFLYRSYEHSDFDPKLFAKPENVKIENARP